MNVNSNSKSTRNKAPANGFGPPSPSYNNQNLPAYMVSSSTQSGKKSMAQHQEDQVLSMMSDAFKQKAEERFYKEALAQIQSQGVAQTPQPPDSSRIHHHGGRSLGNRTPDQHLKIPNASQADRFRQSHGASTQAGSTVNHTKNQSSHHHQHLRQYMTPHSHSSREDCHHAHRPHAESSNSIGALNSRQRKSTRSLRSSCGADSNPERDDRAFVYPCHAFKQFVLTLKEGKIDLNDLGKHPDNLRAVMNKSSDLGRAYQKVFNKIHNNDPSHLQDKSRLSVSSIKQLESVNRLTYGQRCPANPCRSGSRGSDSYINDTMHLRNSSALGESATRKPINVDHSHHSNHSPPIQGRFNKGGSHSKNPSTFSSSVKAPHKEPIIEVESHQNSPNQSPVNKNYNTPAPQQFSNTLRDDKHTPMPLMNPDSGYPIFNNRQRISSDNFDLEDASDGVNPWRLIQNIPKPSKNTASGAISSYESKPGTPDPTSSKKQRHIQPNNNSSGKKPVNQTRHKPSASMQIPAVPQQPDPKHLQRPNHQDPKYSTPNQTHGVVNSGQKPRSTRKVSPQQNFHLIDASQPYPTNRMPQSSNKKDAVPYHSNKIPTNHRIQKHDHHQPQQDDVWSSSNNLERPHSNLPVRQPEQQKPQYLSSSGSFTGPNPRQSNGSISDSLVNGPQSRKQKDYPVIQPQQQVKGNNDWNTPNFEHTQNKQKPMKPSQAQNKPISQQLQDTGMPHSNPINHAQDFDPRCPPTEQPIRGLELTPPKAKGSKDPFPSELYGRPSDPKSSQLKSPVDPDRASLPLSSQGQLPTRHSMTGKTPASVGKTQGNTPIEQVPQSANSTQACPSKKDRLIQKDKDTSPFNPHSPFSKSKNDGRHSRPEEHFSEEDSYNTDDVRKMLQSNKDPQYATIQGLQAPDDTVRHPFVRYDGDGEDTLMNQASPVFHTGFPDKSPAIKQSKYSPKIDQTGRPLSKPGTQDRNGSQSIDRVMGKWDAPLPDKGHPFTQQQLNLPSQRKSPGLDNQSQKNDRQKGKEVSPGRQDVIRGDLIDQNGANVFNMKRQSSVGDGLQQPGCISPIPADYYPEYVRSTTSLLDPALSAGAGNPGARNGSGKKRVPHYREKNPSVPNLSNLISADPSRDGDPYSRDSRSRKTPVSGLSKVKDRPRFGKHKRFSPNDLNDNEDFDGDHNEVEDDEEIQDLSGTTSYYTSQLNHGLRNMDLTYQPQPYVVMPPSIRPEDFKLQSLLDPSKPISNQGISPSKFLKSSVPERSLQNSSHKPTDKSGATNFSALGSHPPHKRPVTDLRTPKKESPQSRKKQQQSSSDQKHRGMTPQQQSLSLSQLQSPQMIGGQTPLQDTLPSELPLNLIIEKAMNKDNLGVGVFGGSFSGHPKGNYRERTSRDQRRKKRELERLESHLGSSSGLRGGPVQDELMKIIMGDINGLRESDVREITTLRNHAPALSDQTPELEMADRRIMHDPHQRLEYLERMMSGNKMDSLGQKTPVPQSKQLFSPSNMFREPNSTQKFEALKMKVENVSEFKPLDFVNSNRSRKEQEPEYMNNRRSRQERSQSSSGERQIEQKPSDQMGLMINSPDKEQDLTLQNYIKQLSGTNKILSPRDQAGSHFQKKKSNLEDLPRVQNEQKSQKKKDQPLSEMLDDFDYRSKSPPQTVKPIDYHAVPQQNYSVTKPQVNQNNDQYSPPKGIQSFTLNPYNQSVPQSAASFNNQNFTPIKNSSGVIDNHQIVNAIVGPYGLPDQPVFMPSQKQSTQNLMKQPQPQRNTPITKQRSGGELAGNIRGGLTSPMSYMERQRSPSDQGLPGRPAMTPSSGMAVSQGVKHLNQNLEQPNNNVLLHQPENEVVNSQQSSRKGFGTFGAGNPSVRHNQEERKQQPLQLADQFQFKDNDSSPPHSQPKKRLASSPNSCTQLQNRYVKQPSSSNHKSKSKKSEEMTPKSHLSQQSRSVKTQSRLRELGNKLQESIIYDGVTMKSIDYRLIHQLQQEAAIVIQRQWREHHRVRSFIKMPKRTFQEERKVQAQNSDLQSVDSIAQTCKHNNACDRGTVTSPQQNHQHHHSCVVQGAHCCCCSQYVSTLSQEKFQAFMASTVHSYMLLNCLMADANPLNHRCCPHHH